MVAVEALDGDAGAPEPSSGRTQLYRHFDKDGVLLYVGVSLSAVQRLSQHRDVSSWYDTIASVQIENYATRAEAMSAERLAIATEHPRHNVNGAGGPEIKRIRNRRAEDSRRDLLLRIVQFNPVYNRAEAEQAVRIKGVAFQRLLDSGALGYVVIGETVRNTPDGPKTIKRIGVTGWQLIDFIESMQGIPA